MDAKIERANTRGRSLQLDRKRRKRTRRVASPVHRDRGSNSARGFCPWCFPQLAKRYEKKAETQAEILEHLKKRQKGRSI